MQTARVAREIEIIKKRSPWGISCDTINENKFDRLEAKLVGPRDSPYESGTFTLLIEIPDKYPFEPPHVKFETPVYHPNIDKDGRICLDLVKMPPKGGWRPTVTLETLLLAIQTLLANPNPDDPLMVDIAHQYRNDRELFEASAKEHTQKYAK